jgi:hypothetical protein
MTIYGLVGIGASVFETMVNSHDESGNAYDFSGINGNVYEDRKATKDQLKDMLDDSYESMADGEGDRRLSSRKTLKPIATGGFDCF